MAYHLDTKVPEGNSIRNVGRSKLPLEGTILRFDTAQELLGSERTRDQGRCSWICDLCRGWESSGLDV